MDTLRYVNGNKVFNWRSDYLGKRVQGRGVESTNENFSPQTGDQLIEYQRKKQIIHSLIEALNAYSCNELPLIKDINKMRE